jgi:hypothetical protein
LISKKTIGGHQREPNPEVKRIKSQKTIGGHQREPNPEVKRIKSQKR